MVAGKRKSDRNPTNVTDKLSLKDPLLRRLSSAADVTRSFLEANDLFLPPSQSLRLESLISSLPIANANANANAIPPSSSSSSAATWFIRFLTSAVEDDDPRWYLYFRMSKPTFFNLFSILSPSSSLPSFAATIFRLAHAASHESLLHRFGFDSIPQASRSFFTVCKLINEKLGQKLDDPKPDFSPNLLPNCCGVLGFGRFKVDGKFLGDSSIRSLVVQALVDSSGRFFDISAGWPNTMRPEAILRQTKLFSIGEEAESSSGRNFLNEDSTKLENGVLVPRYVLGDSCLPLLPWLVTPYNEEDGSFREFNNVVHTALDSVEVAFAKVRDRWRILDRKWKPETIEFLPFVITTGCLLHNFLVSSGDDDGGGDNNETRKDEEEEEEEEEEEDEEEEETKRFEEEEAYIESRKIRDAIAENLSRVSSS